MENDLIKENVKIKCPSCQQKKSTNSWEYKTTEETICIRWCDYCGFGWQYPFPSNIEVSSYYEVQAAYSKKIIDISQGGFPTRIDRLLKLKPSKGRLLDVGSGLGHFLHHAKNAGLNVEGIEPRIEASNYCYKKFGIKVHTGEFEKWADSQPCCYDIITLWDVLEHVHNPFICIEKCLDLLVPGGILVLAIPNSSGLPARLLKGRWRYVMESHLNYFTMPYIYRLLESYNLSIVREDHTFKIQSFIDGFTRLIPTSKQYNKRITNMVNNNKEIRSDGEKSTIQARLIDLLLPIVLKINMMPIPVPIGDLVDIYCRKK